MWAAVGGRLQICILNPLVIPRMAEGLASIHAVPSSHSWGFSVADLPYKYFSVMA